MLIRKWPFGPFDPFAEGADGDSEEGRPADVARKRFGEAAAARRHARKRAIWRLWVFIGFFS
jgi:hypothetical protein